MYKEIYQFLKNEKMVNTHSHHMNDAQHENYNLHTLMKHSYVSWISKVPSTAAEVDPHLLRYGNNSYWRWLIKGLEGIYGIELSSSTFDKLNSLIIESHADKKWHLEILRKICGYERIILDYDFSPGNDINYPDLFEPVLRCDMFAVCNTEESREANGHNSFEFNNWSIDDFDEYLDAIFNLMGNFKGIKFAIAYELGISITNFDKHKGAIAFKNNNATPSEKKDFYDYMVYAICKEAEKKGIVIQIHTGLGFMDNTAPIYLKKLLDACPRGKFLLMHGGFPWSDDTLALIHNYHNVWIDLSWMSLISTEHAKRFLTEALEVGDSHQFTIGCDTFTSEESYGALLANIEVVADVLSKMVDNQSLKKEQAYYIAKRIWSENAKELYSLS